MTIYEGAVFFAMGAWLFTIVEMVGMWRFWPWVYRLGIKVLDEEVPGRSVLQAPSAVVDLPEVMAQRVTPGETLFRNPIQLFGVRLSTPFPIKGTLVTSGSVLRVTGRIPLGTTLFLAAFLVGLTFGREKGGSAPPASFALLAWGVVAVMVAISLPVEIMRIRTARDALVSSLGGGSRR